MSNVILILATAIVTTVVLAYAAYYLKLVIRDDGYHRSGQRPPRSHHTDPFDPRSRFA